RRRHADRGRVVRRAVNRITNRRVGAPLVRQTRSAPSPCPCGERVASPRTRASRVRGRRKQQSHSSLSGLTRQSILFAKKFLRRGWTRGSSPRVTEGLRRETCARRDDAFSTNEDALDG